MMHTENTTQSGTPIASQPPAGPGDRLTPSVPYGPQAHSPRTLVLAFDGTGDQFDSDVSGTSQSPDCVVLNRTLTTELERDAILRVIEEGQRSADGLLSGTPMEVVTK